MLDGQRYYSEFPDEEPPRRLFLSDELLVTLAAIEREISEFIANATGKSDTAGAAMSGGQVKD